jgi:hypothetical protein
VKLTDSGSVVGGAENQFRSSVVSRADIADVGFTGDKDLCWSEITKHEDTGSGVEEKILGFDVSMADPYAVDVGQRSEKLDISNAQLFAMTRPTWYM